MTIPAIAAPAAQATATGAVLCAVSLAASASNTVSNRARNPFELAPTALRIKLPKINLPEINIDLPNLGKKKDAPAPDAAEEVVAPPTGSVKVRASGAAAATVPEARSAPPTAGVSIAPKSDGWKKFPNRRMPGANMDGFKEMAKGMKIGPDMK